MPTALIQAFKEAKLDHGAMYTQPKEIVISIQKMLKSQAVTFSTVYKDDFDIWMTILYPIKDEQGKIFSYFAVDVDDSMIPKGQKTLLFWGSIALGSFLVIILFIQFYFTRKTLYPLKELIKGIDQASQGNFIITLKEGSNELGKVNAKFNYMTKQIREMVTKIKQTSYDVSESSKELYSITEQNSENTEKITNDICEMSININNQKQSTIESANAMNEIAYGIQTIADSSAKVSISAIDMEHKSQEGNQFILKVIDQMKNISITVENASKTIKSLELRSKEIDSIVKVITDIYSQTNLLSLNAAIEAARAGEHGRGFAVVASEVRKLAEQTDNSAKQITSLIKEIQSETLSAVRSMEKGTKEVSIGMEVTKQTGDLFVEILANTEQVTCEIQEVSSASEQISATTEEITATVENLKIIAQTTSENSKNIAFNVDNQKESMDSIAHASQQLNYMSDELEKLISQFKV